MKITIVEPKTFERLLNVVSNFDETAKFEITDNILSVDTSINSFYFRGEYTLPNIKEISQDSFVIPDFRKFVRHIKLIETEDSGYDLNINSNNISYSSKLYKFKYHTYDKNVYKHKKVDVQKIKSLSSVFVVQLQYATIQQIVKITALSDEDTKVYLYTQDNILYCDVTNKSNDNSNNISIALLDNVNTYCESISLNVDFFRILSTCGDVNTLYNLEIKNNKIVVVEPDFGPENKFTFICTSYAK